jgi:actin-related protein 5
MRMNHQLHLNVERIRVPEAFFQPDMFGQDYAGIGELAGWIMNGYDEDLRRRMMQVSHRNLLKNIPNYLVHIRDRRIVHVP